MTRSRTTAKTARIQRHINRYLKAVAKRLRDRPPAEKRELRRTVEDHVHERLHQAAGDGPTVADAKEVLSEMDPPEPVATYQE